MIEKLLIGLNDVEGKNRNLLASRIDVNTRQYSTFSHAREELPINGYIELWGAWEDMCIYSTVLFSLENGTKVRIPKGFTIKSSAKKPPLLEDLRQSNPHISFVHYANKDYLFSIPNKLHLYCLIKII